MPLDTTVKYLIKHSISGEFLYPSSSGSSIKTTTLTETEKNDPKYQWSIKSGLLIESVSQSSYLNAGTPTGDVYPAILDASTRLKWIISPEEVDQSVQLALHAPGSPASFYLYRTGSADVKLSATQSNYSGQQYWILTLAAPPKAVIQSLIPSKNPLPIGTYRIRAFNGSFMLTMPNSTQAHQDRNVYVSKRKAGTVMGPFQRWELGLSESSGLYTIKNVGTGLYLSPPGSQGLQGDFLVGQTSPFTSWTVQTTDMGVMFFIGLLGTRPLSIGFPNYEGGDLSEVKLEPSDSVPSQIWFFESLDVNALPPSENAMHFTSLLEAKDYNIKNCHDNDKYLSVDTNDQVKLAAYVPKTKLTVAYPSDASGGFTLSYKDSSGDVEYLCDAIGQVELREKKPTLWVALPREDDSGATGIYHICDATTGLSAISGRAMKKGRVPVDPFAQDDEAQWWTFETAS
ncbi:hypothetical protein CVT26_003581 [Gymnopilus dilepis]|uniref:Ricin B lectin domain-containing protein n=1 Tax=Gymnopilus dilepis TaxID=231916 RepID=A0A409VSC5_9AGAR|nr:hypothetical protein CVT26_003581 [Gymnopilus dilepis]